MRKFRILTGIALACGALWFVNRRIRKPHGLGIEVIAVCLIAITAVLLKALDES
jgi:uncharacterized membrane protein